ncbi:MAG: hypothetical protein LBF02_00960 [Mycoplasmataceae bacterium]|nr:hypothetical protein [Mycoplasmataceae bacterium]
MLVIKNQYQWEPLLIKNKETIRQINIITSTKFIQKIVVKCGYTLDFSS